MITIKSTFIINTPHLSHLLPAYDKRLDPFYQIDYLFQNVFVTNLLLLRMKKTCLFLVVLFALILQFCTSTYKAISRKNRKVTYVNNIQPIVMNSCSPCHIPPEGKKKAYNTYAAVKASVDSMLIRIRKNPNEKGFMPARRPKLSDSTINIFVQWKKDGLLER